MKYCIQVFFTSGQSHNFFIERNDMEEVDEFLLDLKDDHQDFSFAANEGQSFLINKKNVILIAASPVKEIEEDKVETICCSGEKCH